MEVDSGSGSRVGYFGHPLKDLSNEAIGGGSGVLSIRSKHSSS
jgi:hypothetical protein